MPPNCLVRGDDFRDDQGGTICKARRPYTGLLVDSMKMSRVLDRTTVPGNRVAYRHLENGMTGFALLQKFGGSDRANNLSPILPVVSMRREPVDRWTTFKLESNMLCIGQGNKYNFRLGIFGQLIQCMCELTGRLAYSVTAAFEG